MKRVLYLLFLVVILALLNGYMVNRLDRFNAENRGKTGIFMLSPTSERFVSLEYEGIRAFQLSLALRVFIGEEVELYKKVPRSLDSVLIKSVNVITALNPYYYGVYYFSSMLLMWELGEPEEALKVLKKGVKYLNNNSNLYFFIGFDYFYFLHDPLNGAKYLKLAARYEKRTGNKLLYSTMAARLLSEVGKTEVAISILDYYIKHTQEKDVKEYLKKHRQELMMVLSVQMAAKKYAEIYGHRPHSVEELVKNGFLRSVPISPLGREIYIDRDGRVKVRKRSMDNDS